MSYYGGTVTAQGRNLITSLIAGETIEFTRIMVGSGSMPDGVEPIDMTDLVTPVAEGTSTSPVVEDGVLSMTVQYRNDLNGGLETGFWLREFGVYAKTADTEEVLLYYATLGDSPQPVNAYQDNRIDIRNYPITIALLVDADVQVTYKAGAYITSEDAQNLIDAAVNNSVAGSISSLLENTANLEVVDITIVTGAWQVDADATDKYVYVAEVANDTIKESHYPHVVFTRETQDIVTNCGMCGEVETEDGLIRFRAMKIAADTITATLYLFTAGGTFDADSINVTYTLPVATATTLGGVMIGDGISVTEDGTISSSAGDAASSSDDDVSEMLDTVYPDTGDSTDLTADDSEVDEMLETVYGDEGE